MNKRIGEKWITNEGYKLEIIEYFNRETITAKFDNGYIAKNLRYQNIKNGEIKNPFHKSVYGIGYYGVGNFVGSVGRKMTKVYQTWLSMITRCYSDVYHKTYPTYIDCTVCDEWHNYQIFAEWFEINYIEGYQLDKDILFKGNKVYSPNTCCFVPQEINSLFIKCKKINYDLPLGVSKAKADKKYKSWCWVENNRIYLGSFDTSEQAFNYYKKTKESEIKRVAELWKPQLKPNVYDALINYTIEITD